MTRAGYLLSACWLLGSCAALWATGPAPSPQIPFSFAQNQGQAGPRVKAIGTGARFTAWLEQGGFVLRQGQATTRVDFVGADSRAAMSFAEPIGASANFLEGRDPASWRTGVPLYGAVSWANLWPGIGLTLREDRANMKLEYAVAAGAGIDAIRLRFDGAIAIGADGSLTVRNATGEFREEKPFLYQDGSQGRTPVPGRFVVIAPGVVGFEARYDRSRPLVIDPSVQFSGYFGGSAQDNITSVAITSTFNAVVAGWTNSLDLPSSLGARTVNGGGVDAFVAGFNPNGQLLYCTYLGGSGDDRAFGVAVDAANNTYVTGWSSSRNFPVAGKLQTRLSGARDAFVAKLNPAGSALVYSVYLGGSGVDLGNAIAVDALGQAVIVGDTTSMNLPVTAGAFQRTPGGGQDAFIAGLAADGASLSFLSYFGGNNTDHSTSIQLDPAGQIVIAGSTSSVNLPVLAALQPHSGGGQDGFVAKFNGDATALVYSTYLGGSGGSAGLPEQVNSIVIGPSRNIVVAGITSSMNFPVTGNSLQPVYGGGQTDGFMAKINWKTGALMVATYLGGSSNDGINGIAGDMLGRVYITGFTLSGNFPTASPASGASASGASGSMEAFAATLSSALNQLTFSTYLGGSGSDSGNAIAVDTLTSMIVAGQTSSPDFPSAGGNLKSIPTQILSSFITKLAPDWTLSVASGPLVTVDSYHIGGLAGLVTSTIFGQAGDIPVAGDWTGSGVKRAGIFRNGTWILDTNGSGLLDAGDQVVSFGQAGDLPVVGDWTGSGRAELGLYRAGTFILDLSGHLSGFPTGLPDATFSFGLPTDIPIVGDWNASGTSKVGVFRDGLWLVDYNGDHLFNTLDKTYSYGQAGDIPVTGSWDSTGFTRLGVYRGGAWILNFAGTNVFGVLGITDLSIAFGLPGQTPIVR